MARPEGRARFVFDASQEPVTLTRTSGNRFLVGNSIYDGRPSKGLGGIRWRHLAHFNRRGQMMIMYGFYPRPKAERPRFPMRCMRFPRFGSRGWSSPSGGKV